MTVTETLHHYPLLYLCLVAVGSLAVGSFLNVVIHRLPVMMDRSWRQQCHEYLELEQSDPARDNPPFDLLRPRSRCPECGHPIAAWENIPVVSYLLLRGRCSGCGTRISPRYPIVEITTAVLSVVVAWQLGVGSAALAAIVLTWALIALSLIDFDHKLLPDNIVLPLLWLGLLLNLFGTFTDLQSAVIGAIAGYLSLWLIFQTFRLITGKEGMGYGDFKLFALFGAWLGWQYLFQIILLSSLVGAVVGIALIALRGQDRSIPIPFGPYLAVAGWISLLWGDQINRFYLQWAGLA